MDNKPSPQLEEPEWLKGFAFRVFVDRSSEAGLFDPPFRPSYLSDLPPYPLVVQQAGALPKWEPNPVSPTLRKIPGGGMPRTAVRPGAPGPLAWLGALATLASLLELTEDTPTWADATNPISKVPYSTPQEYEWVQELTPLQRDYVAWLYTVRHLAPEPALENDPASFPSPLPVPGKDANPKECFSIPVPRRGGHKRHDAYASKVSHSPLDYYACTPSGLFRITYDGRSPGTMLVWEVKVGFEWFYNPKYSSLRTMVLARFDAQKNRGLAVAKLCGFQHVWSIPSPRVAGLLLARWGGAPPVLNLPE